MSTSGQGRPHKWRRQTLGNFTIDFGRHRGKKVHQLPRDYLGWIASRRFRGDRAIQWVVRQYLKLNRTSRKRRVPAYSP